MPEYISKGDALAIARYSRDVVDGIEQLPTVEVPECIARPLEEWHEDIGDVLWWKFPIEEPPYVGGPLDGAWSGYHTHWTPIVVPQPPKEGNDG